MTATTILRAGVPATNLLLFHRIRFRVGDPAAVIDLSGDASYLIVRGIEMERARRDARVDEVSCPEDWVPAGGLSGDREIATAQATAEFLRRRNVSRVRTDRSLPMIYVHELAQAGIAVECDPQLGVLERRAKDDAEIAGLRAAQAVTEEMIAMACRMVCRAVARTDGVLLHEGTVLTSERVRTAIDVALLERGFANGESIVAGGPLGADCHDRGHGPLRTGEPVIIDIFPHDRRSGYWGDCTRTCVHGTVPAEVRAMHAAVVEAKAAAIAAVRAGVSGEEIHAVSGAIMGRRGYAMGMPPEDAPPSWCGMTHGTGHGIGLEVHEPPLLDRAGPVLIAGDALTIEPGLYCRAVGGVRIEDMVIVTETGCDNLNTLPEGLTDW